MSGTNPPHRNDDALPDPNRLAPPTTPPLQPPNPSDAGSAPTPSTSPVPEPSAPAEASEPTVSNEGRSDRTSKRSHRIWIAVGVLAIVAATAVGYVLFQRLSTPDGHGDERSLPALPTDEHTGWIGSGTYQIPEEVPPGLYRVGREFSIREDGDDVDRQSSVTYEGMTLVMIPPSAPPARIEIGGGAWPLKENGPVDPTRFADGTYLVGFDLEPGTYRVTPVKNGLNIANAGIVDEGGQITKSDYLDSSDSAAGVRAITIEIESTDFAFYFSGHLEKVD